MHPRVGVTKKSVHFICSRFRTHKLCAMEVSGPAVDAIDGAKERVEREKPKMRSSSSWKLYVSRFLTAWGDNLWIFGLGLFLLRVRYFGCGRNLKHPFIGINQSVRSSKKIVYPTSIGTIKRMTV